MKKLFWLGVGIWVGSVGIKKVRENAKYADMLDRAGQLTKELRDSLTEGFNERESELRKQSKNDQ